MDSTVYTPRTGNEYYRGQPLRIGCETQLLHDDAVVEDTWNVRRMQQRPLRCNGNPVLIADRPWEKGHVYGPCVMYDEEESLYRMWYWSFERDAYFHGTDLSEGRCMYKMLYAESTDGLCWTKPEFDFIPYGKYKKNNIVYTGTNGAAYGRVFTLPGKGGPKFGMLYNDKGCGPSFACSEDGRRWSFGHALGGIVKSDCFINPLYDESRGMWQLLARPKLMALPAFGKHKAGEHRLMSKRRVALCESPDLVNWSPARTVFFPDEPDGRMELDNINAFVLHGRVFAFVNCFTPDFEKPAGQRMRPYLAFSDDAYRWQRLPERVPIIDYGRPGDFDDCSAIISGQPVQGPDDMMVVYYSGSSWTDETFIAQSAIGRLLFRRDGFVERCSDGEGGWLVTREFLFEGNALEINCRSGGPNAVILAELTTFENGSETLLEGFTRDDCDPVCVSVDRHTLTWKGSANLESLRGRRIYLRFYLKNAGLYSFTVKDRTQ